MIKAAIAGSTGYTGIELVRILQNHPEVSVVFTGTESYVGQKIHQVYPHLQDIINFEGEVQTIERMAEKSDVVFTALPHGLASKIAPDILNAGKKLIDLGADFRLQNVADYKQWYQLDASSDMLSLAVYGLPEIQDREKISAAKLVANPGCYPTSCALAAFPVLKNKLIETNNIIFDAKSGVSGAGRGVSLNMHFSEMNENFKAYQIAGVHRHTPEIEQTLSTIAKTKVQVQFTPHVIPMVRGLMTTAYFQLKHAISAKEIWQVYSQTYEDEPFVRLRPLGDLPQTKQVSGSNYCDLGLDVDSRTNRLIVVSVIDNLIKGASGQAVQNMNLMFGFPETLGLKNLIPMYP